MTSGVPAIEVHGLTKAYGDHQAVRGIDFTVARGEVFGLLGPNGAGKTTTVEVLEGYRTRDSGTVTVLGHDPESRLQQPAWATLGDSHHLCRANLATLPGARGHDEHKMVGVEGGEHALELLAGG